MRITLNRILTAAAAGLAALIALLTAAAFLTRTAAPGRSLRDADPSPARAAESSGGKAEAAFTGIGRLRACAKPEDGRADGFGTPVVVTPWFSYPAGDTAFYEELARKSGVIKSVILLYFSQYTEAQLLAMGERRIKDDILEQINGQLVLGRLSAVYFSEYIFLE